MSGVGIRTALRAKPRDWGEAGGSALGAAFPSATPSFQPRLVVKAFCLLLLFLGTRALQCWGLLSWGSREGGAVTILID